MSGHNKWSQIKVKKGAEDAKRSKIFSMLSKIVSIESKKSKGDKNAPGLRKAIERAKEANMPNDNIERAIQKGAGGESGQLEEVVYEAYGPGGVAFLIEGITDNKNRITSEIRHVLLANGGNLGGQGSVMWAFKKTEDGWEAKTPLEISEQDKKASQKLLEALEEHEDIKKIYTNIIF